MCGFKSHLLHGYIVRSLSRRSGVFYAFRKYLAIHTVIRYNGNKWTGKRRMARFPSGRSRAMNCKETQRLLVSYINGELEEKEEDRKSTRLNSSHR